MCARERARARSYAGSWEQQQRRFVPGTTGHLLCYHLLQGLRWRGRGWWDLKQRSLTLVVLEGCSVCMLLFQPSTNTPDSSTELNQVCMTIGLKVFSFCAESHPLLHLVVSVRNQRETNGSGEDVLVSQIILRHFSLSKSVSKTKEKTIQRNSEGRFKSKIAKIS